MGQACTKAGREEAAFLKAVKDGDCTAVQQAVLRHVEFAYRAQTWNGQSVFHLSARYGRVDVLETVVEAVRLNPAGPEKWSKLLRMGHSTEAILKSFANLQDARCQTPLHIACIYGNAEVAKLLLQLGATPWAWDELGGRTPLHYAASMGHVDCIQALLSHNVQPPTGEALRRPNSSRTKLVDVCNDSGYTPLHYAVWAGSTSSIRALVSYDASLSSRNVACGSDWVVSCLKCTPLHLAAHKGNAQIVKLLLSAYVQNQVPPGADAPTGGDHRRRRDPRRHVNANRQLPYHVAVSRNHNHLAEMLHPDVPFTFILSPAEMEAAARMYGVPKLSVLAATMLQKKLVSDIDAAVAAMATGRRLGAASASINSMAGGTAAVAGGTASRTASGSMAAMSAALVAEAVAAREGSVRAGGAASACAIDATAQGQQQQQQQQQQVQQRGSLRTPLELATAGRATLEAAAAGGGGGAGKDVPPIQEAGSGGSSCGDQSSPPSAGSGSGSSQVAEGPGPAVGGAGTAQDGAQRLQKANTALPLPPAPISSFLTAAAGLTPAATVPLPATTSSATPAIPARPHSPLSHAESAFAMFAAEPFNQATAAAAAAATAAAAASSSNAAAEHDSGSSVQSSQQQQGDVAAPLLQAAQRQHGGSSSANGAAAGVQGGGAGPSAAPRGAGRSFTLDRPPSGSLSVFARTRLGGNKPSAGTQTATAGAAAPSGALPSAASTSSPTVAVRRSRSLRTLLTSAASRSVQRRATVTSGNAAFAAITAAAATGTPALATAGGSVPGGSVHDPDLQHSLQQQMQHAGYTDHLDDLDDILLALHPHDAADAAANASTRVDSPVGTSSRPWHRSLTGAPAAGADAPRAGSPLRTGVDSPMASRASRAAGALAFWRRGGAGQPLLPDGSTRSEPPNQGTPVSPVRPAAGFTITDRSVAAGVGAGGGSGVVAVHDASVAGAPSSAGRPTRPSASAVGAVSPGGLLRNSPVAGSSTDAPSQLQGQQQQQRASVQGLVQGSPLLPAASVPVLPGGAGGVSGSATAAAVPLVHAAGVDGTLQQLMQLATLADGNPQAQQLLRRARLLQLTQGLDLQELLREHGELSQAVAAAAGGAGPGAGAVPGALGGSVGRGGLMARTRSEQVPLSAHALAVRGAVTVTALGAGEAKAGEAEEVRQGEQQQGHYRVTWDGGAGRSSRGLAAVALPPPPPSPPSSATPTGEGASTSVSAFAALAEQPLEEAPSVGASAAASAAPAVAPPPSSPGPSPLTAVSAFAAVQQAAAAPSLDLTATAPPPAADSTAAAAAVVAAANANAAAAAAAQQGAVGSLFRKASSRPGSEAGDRVCGVCFDQPDNLVITGCKHRLCADCSRELCRLNTFKPALCPFCRGVIGGFKCVPY